MSSTKNLLITAILLCITTITTAQTDASTLIKDFKKISGSWYGTLTYLDYTSGEPFTMLADLKIERISKSNKFYFFSSYPNEPNANGGDTIIISEDGKYINNELIKSRTVLSDGTIEIITEETGTDGNDDQPAVFRHTYTFSKSTYSKRKDVQFVGTDVWVKRHEYSYSKKPK